MSARALFAGAASLLVLVAMAAGIVVIGPPWQARDLRLDERRLWDLQAISAAVEEHARGHGALPESLDALQMRAPRHSIPLDDPVSAERYDYGVTGASSYELCARFDAASEPRPRVLDGWEHPSGHHCFELEVPPVPSHNR